MEPVIYAEMAAQEDWHWWFTARRRLINEMLKSFVPQPTGASMLEVGCGSGGNLPLLAQWSNGCVDAIEPEPNARQKAVERKVATVTDGRLPDQLPGFQQTHDVVVLFDTLEHLAEPVNALKALRANMSPEGRFLITVPAYNWLWSSHDEQHHHYRRYTRHTLTRELHAAGVTIDMISYCNTLLFLPAAAQRLAARRFPDRVTTQTDTLPQWMTRVFYHVFSFERHLVNRVPLPFGLSLYAIARPAS